MPILLRMPTLSERRQDIPALAQWALAEHARSRRENPKRLGPGVDEELARREWHGNMLELRAVLVRAHQRAGTRSTVNLPDLPHDNDPGGHPSQHRKDEGQRDALLRQLQAAGSIRRAAELEGIARPNYIRLMKRLGIIRADTHPYGEDEA
jgi:two-component system nitrogen regulation response regulator NtrX